MAFKKISEKFVFFGSLVGVLVTILTAIDKIQEFFSDVFKIKITPVGVSFISELLNVLVLLVFYFATKPTELIFTEEEIVKLSETLNIKDTENKKQNSISKESTY